MIEDPLSEDLKTAITAWAACSYAYDEVTEALVAKVNYEAHMLISTLEISA
jgi:hypothetical protein